MIKQIIVLVSLLFHFACIGQMDTINQHVQKDTKQGYWIYYGKGHMQYGPLENGKGEVVEVLTPPVKIADSSRSEIESPHKRGCVTGNSGFRPNDYNKIYNENDDIWQDGEFRNRRLWAGKVYLYDENGKLIKVRWFIEGVYHSDMKNL